MYVTFLSAEKLLWNDLDGRYRYKRPNILHTQHDHTLYKDLPLLQLPATAFSIHALDRKSDTRPIDLKVPDIPKFKAALARRLWFKVLTGSYDDGGVGGDVAAS
jgi:hypothetical protein